MLVESRVELIDGYGISCRIDGEGPAFVWAHSLLSSMEAEVDWALFDWPRVSEAAELVRYDAVGHGASAGRSEAGDHRFASLGADMIQLAARLGLERFVAGGISMGAATSLYAALAAPDRVCGLVLVAPPLTGAARSPLAAAHRTLAMAATVGALEPWRLVARLIPATPPLRRLRANLALSMVRQLSTMDRRQLAAILNGAAASDLPEAGDLASIDVPALVLGWSRDPLHPVRSAERLAATLPRAELVIADTAAEAGAFTELIADFVARAG